MAGLCGGEMTINENTWTFLDTVKTKEKELIVVLYFQEINLAWDEVQSLVPKRDDLLKNEKGRQERILYDAYSLQRIQFHSLSELTIQDYSSEWFCCSPYSCVNIFCWPLRPGLSLIVKIYMKPNWKKKIGGEGGALRGVLQAQLSSWREDNSEEIYLVDRAGLGSGL